MSDEEFELTGKQAKGGLTMRKEWLWLIIGAVAMVSFALGLYTRGAKGFHIPGLPLFVYVEIRGDVRNPGVYKFLRGARISHALEAAGRPRVGRDYIIGQGYVERSEGPYAAIYIEGRAKNGTIYTSTATKLEDEMMVMVTRAVNCPNCGEWLKIDEGKQYVDCPSCFKRLTISALEGED